MYKEEINRLVQEIDSLKNEKDEISNNFNEKTAQLVEVRRNAKTENESTQIIQKKLTEVQFALEQEKKKTDKLTLEIEELLDTIQNLISEKNKGENLQIQHLINENSILQRKIMEQSDIIDDLNSENVFLNKINNQDTQEVLTQDDSSVDMEYSSIINNNLNFKRQIKYSQSTIENLTNSNRDLMNINIELQKLYDELKTNHTGQINVISEANARMDKQNEIKNNLESNLEVMYFHFIKKNLI